MAEAVDEILPDALDGQRVDRVVALVAGISRSQASALIAEGGVLLDGRAVARPSEKVMAGAHLVVPAVAEPAGLVGDPSIPLELVHVDEHVIVVDKPAGLVVHPGTGVASGTLVHALLGRFPELAGVGEADRPGIVHRLDKGTSGLLVVARTEPARAGLVEQLAARTVERRYQTLVWGDVEADQGLIDAPIGKSARQATLQAVVASGRPARTRYEVIRRHPGAGGQRPASGRLGGATGLWCRLETGRTHQIRVHLAAIGHPVVGDDVYGGSPAGSDLELPPDRPFLHAQVLGFTHPVSGAALRFESPLPADLAAVLDRLSGGGG